jgi:hypothetical protein
MDTAVLIGVLVAAGLLMTSGIWVGLVLFRAVTRIKRPPVTVTHEALDGDVPGSGRL